jgi:hypothetical protein
MFGVTMLMEEFIRSLGIDPVQAKAVFDDVQKEAPDLIARIRTFDERLAGIEQTNQQIVQWLNGHAETMGIIAARTALRPGVYYTPDRRPGDPGYVEPSAVLRPVFPTVADPREGKCDLRNPSGYVEPNYPPAYVEPDILPSGAD